VNLPPHPTVLLFLATFLRMPSSRLDYLRHRTKIDRVASVVFAEVTSCFPQTPPQFSFFFLPTLPYIPSPPKSSDFFSEIHRVNMTSRVCGDFLAHVPPPTSSFFPPISLSLPAEFCFFIQFLNVFSLPAPVRTIDFFLILARCTKPS